MISIGIDVHKNRCVATIKQESRRKLEQSSFDNTTHGITSFILHIKRTYGKNVQAVCESTANYWIRLHDALEDNGIDTVLAHPAKTKIIAQAKLKNDKLDSDVLADLLRSDMVYESFVPEKYYRDLRSLVRTRLNRIQSRTKHKNMIYAILAKYDYTQPTIKTFSQKGIQWLHEINLTEVDRMAMDAYLENIEITQKQIDTFETKIAAISNEDTRTRLLMSMPGINYVTALTILSEIVDIKRFATAEKLVSYAGLAPSHRDSDQTQKGGGITKRGSAWLRNAMVEAANTTIRFDPRMESFYSRIAKRRGKQKAKVAAARQMLEIIWHMLSNSEEYRTQNHELTLRKYKKMKLRSKLS